MIPQILATLEEAKLDALKAMVKVGDDPSLFAYGRRVGLHEGLEHAKTLIVKLLRDQDARDQQL